MNLVSLGTGSSTGTSPPAAPLQDLRATAHSKADCFIWRQGPNYSRRTQCKGDERRVASGTSRLLQRYACIAPSDTSAEHRYRPSNRHSFFHNTRAQSSVCDEVRTSKCLDGLALATGHRTFSGEVRRVETSSVLPLIYYYRFPSFDEPHRFNIDVYETLIEILSAARVYIVIFEVGLKSP